MRSLRQAFTLVELLVVIAVIGVLIALLLPAVQAARESARRASCTNNLKQIGLAMHMHHDTYQRFPPGWAGYVPNSTVPQPLGTPGWGWAAMTLPFIEQENLYRQRVHLDLPIMDPANAEARVSVIPTFRCPSDSADRTFDADKLHLGHDHEHEGEEHEYEGEEAQFAMCNYIGMFGTGDLDDCAHLAPGEQCRGDGCLFHNSEVTIADIRDGTSQTLLVGERSTRTGYSTWVGVPPYDECMPAAVLGAANDPPNLRLDHAHNFSSDHPAGTNFLLADGSVRMIAETIDRATYHALTTRRAGDVAANSGP